MTAHAAENAVADLALVYAETRSVADLARLRDAVRRSPGFDAGLDVVGAVSPALARGAHEEAVAIVEALMPAAFFSPSAHAALGAARAALGDDAQARASAGETAPTTSRPTSKPGERRTASRSRARSAADRVRA